MIIRKLISITLICLLRLSGFSQFINPGVVLTFDDNAIDNWYKLLPLFEKYQAKATFFVTLPNGITTDMQDKLMALHDAGNEIGSHGYFHYNAVKFTDTASIESYLYTEILPSINLLNTALGISISSFAYPFGARNSKTDSCLMNHFKVIRGTNYALSSMGNKVSKLSHSGLVHAVGLDNSYGYSLAEIKKSLDDCLQYNLIQLFYSHKPVDSLVGEYQVTYAKLDSILHYASQIGLAFYTISETSLPIPPKPEGPIYIDDSTTSSDYVVENKNYDVEWKLLPEESGNLLNRVTASTIYWEAFIDQQCTLQAAYLNPCGQGDFSPPLEIQVSNLMYLHDKYDLKIKIYPNPSTGTIHIKAPDISTEKILEIYSSTGMLLFTTPAFFASTSVSIPEKGLYLVRVVEGHKTFSKWVLFQ